MNLHLGTYPNQPETRSLNASKTARRVPLLYLVVRPWLPVSLASNLKDTESQSSNLDMEVWSLQWLRPSIERFWAIVYAPETQTNPCWMDGHFISRTSQPHSHSNANGSPSNRLLIITGLINDWVYCGCTVGLMNIHPFIYMCLGPITYTPTYTST